VIGSQRVAERIPGGQVRGVSGSIGVLQATPPPLEGHAIDRRLAARADPGLHPAAAPDDGDPYRHRPRRRPRPRAAGAAHRRPRAGAARRPRGSSRRVDPAGVRPPGSSGRPHSHRPPRGDLQRGDVAIGPPPQRSAHLARGGRTGARDEPGHRAWRPGLPGNTPVPAVPRPAPDDPRGDGEAPGRPGGRGDPHRHAGRSRRDRDHGPGRRPARRLGARPCRAAPEHPGGRGAVPLVRRRDRRRRGAGRRGAAGVAPAGGPGAPAAARRGGHRHPGLGRLPPRRRRRPGADRGGRSD